MICTRRILLTSVLLLLVSAVLGFSGSINLSTGVSGGATYTVVEQNSYNMGATATASLVTPSDPDWFGGWIANSSTSAWIAYDPTNCCDNGLGNYSTSFTLTSANVSAASLSGNWTLDDSGTLLLNGNVIGTLGDGSWGALTSFSVPAGSSDFVVGTNTLSIDTTDTDNFLEGVNLQGTLSTSSSTPEPAEVLLLGTGLLALAWLARTRLRTAD